MLAFARPVEKVWRVFLFIAVLVGMGLFCVIAGTLGLKGLWQFTDPGHLTFSSVRLIITGINDDLIWSVISFFVQVPFFSLRVAAASSVFFSASVGINLAGCRPLFYKSKVYVEV